MPFLVAAAFVLLVAQLGGMFWLSPRLAKTQYGYRVSLRYTIRLWLLLGISGWWSAMDSTDDTSPFGRRMRLTVDNARTNAQEIAAERRLLANLMALPPDTHGLVAARIRESEARLAALRAYDNDITALIGLGVLAPDVDRAKLTIEAVADLITKATPQIDR